MRVSICEFSGLKEAREEINFNVYPNPGAGKFAVNVAGGKQINYELLNSNEKVILKGEQENGQDILLNLADNENGIYFLRRNSNGKSGISKIIKQN